MRKKTIAKAQIIAGVVLIVIAICLNYFFIKSGTGYVVDRFDTSASIVSEYNEKNQMTEWQIVSFFFSNGTQLGSNVRLALGLGILLDLIILAQAIILITMGLRKLAEP